LWASADIAGQECYRLALEFSELRFTVVGKNLRDRFFCSRDDHDVAVDEFPSETLGDDRSDRAFPVAMNPVRISLGVILKKAPKRTRRINSCGPVREIPSGCA